MSFIYFFLLLKLKRFNTIIKILLSINAFWIGWYIDSIAVFQNENENVLSRYLVIVCKFANF